MESLCLIGIFLMLASRIFSIYIETTLLGLLLTLPFIYSLSISLGLIQTALCFGVIVNFQLTH